MGEPPPVRGPTTAGAGDQWTGAFRCHLALRAVGVPGIITPFGGYEVGYRPSLGRPPAPGIPQQAFAREKPPDPLPGTSVQLFLGLNGALSIFFF